MVNRYAQLISLVPKGSFYDAAGDILPYRSDPYSFLYSPVTPNRTFGIYVNDVFRGTTQSDGTGKAVVSVQLDLGEQDIVLVDTIDQSRFSAPGVTVRLYATVLASHADVFSSIDASIDEIEQSMALETATPRFISDVFGRPLRQPNDLGVYLTDTYRRLLFRLRQAYRLFGSKLTGVRQAVFAYTGSVPLRLPKAWRADWVLGAQLLPNGDLQTYARVTDAATMATPVPNANQRVPVFIHAAYGGTTIFPGPFTNPPIPQVLTVTFSVGWLGGAVLIMGTDVNGTAVTETIAPPSGATFPITVTGRQVFVTVTGATMTTAGVWTASIGLGLTLFLRVLRIGSLNAGGGGAQNLNFTPGIPDTLTWGGGPAISIAAAALPPSGIVTLRDQDQPADWFGLNLEPGGGGGYVLSSPAIVAANTEAFLALELDGKGIVVVDLSADVGGGGGPPYTAAMIAATINTAFGADTRYGGPGGPYGAVATVANDLAGQGHVVRLTCPGLVVGPDSSIRIHPWGADGAFAIFGEPRFSVYTTASPPVRGVTASLQASPRIPAIAEPIVLNPAFVDSTPSTPITGGFVQPAYATALQVYFDGAWQGGNVQVQGTLIGGGIGTDAIAPPASRVVASGTNATITILAGIATVTFGAPDDPSPIQPGMFIRFTTGFNAGQGDYVRWINGLGYQLEQTVGTMSAVVGVSWTAYQDVIGQGALGFESIAQIVNVTPHAAPPANTPPGTATLTVLGGETLGYTVRLGRSARAFGAPGDTITAIGGGVTATYQFGVATRLEYTDLGGFLRIDGATTPGNDGLHPIIGFGTTGGPSFTGATLTIEHQRATTGGVFTSEALPGPGTAILYNGGQIVRVAAFDGVATATLYPPGARILSRPTARFEVADEMPFLSVGRLGSGTVEVQVDRLAIPAAPTSDSISLFGQPVPDGFRALNQAANVGQDIPGYFDASRFVIHGSGVDTDGLGTTDMALDVALPAAVVEAYRGFVIQAQFWVQQDMTSPGTQSFQVEFSFQVGLGGAEAFFAVGTAVPGSVPNPNAVPFHMINSGFSGTFGGSLDPTLVAAQVEVPFNATLMTIRLRHLGTAGAVPNAYAAIDRVVVVSQFGSSLYLGHGTVPLSAQQAAFGEVLYVWSPEPLSVAEKTAMGLPQPPKSTASTPVVQATIDNVVNAHGYWERFDVTEYLAGAPVNLVGTYGAVAWAAATLTNMKVVLGVPSRLTVVVPSDISLVTETLTIVPPSNATLAGTSAHAGVISGPAPQAVPGLVSAVAILAGPQLQDPNAFFPTNVAGQFLTVAGSQFPLNDGRFPITLWVDPHTVQYTNVNAVAEPTFSGTYTIDTVFPEESFPDEMLFEHPTPVPAGDIGVPVPASPAVLDGTGVYPWRFLSATVVQIASLAAGDPANQVVFNPAATYTLQYRRLIRAETPAFDLGTGFADYLWLVDAAIYERREPFGEPFNTREQVQFQADFQATLQNRSNSDQTTATLTADNGITTTTVPATNWRFVDAQTIAIDAAVFDPNSLYVLAYTALEPSYAKPASYVIELRSSNVSLLDVANQFYRVVQLDDLVDRTARWHQLRVTFTGVVDVRDVELAGLGLRGIHLYGVAPNAPGIIIP